ncbi:MAG: hypothetical protein ACXWDN_10815 [Limisphaerales bacterium]
MLFQATVSPKLLAGLPADPDGQKMFCNLWLGMLYDFVESCVVVFPHNNATEADYLNALGAWPPKYQKRARELLAMLVQKHRFVSSQTYTPATTCLNADCQPFIGVSISNPANYHFTDVGCISCANATALAPRSLEAIEYFISEFSRKRRQAVAYVLGDNQWTQPKFEQEILKPLLASSKHIKIYDRWIGRSVLDRTRTHVAFNKNYKRTLEWVAHIFQAVGGGSRSGIFEIYCGLDHYKISNTHKAQIRLEMQNFEKLLQSTYGISARIYLKKETPQSQCPHGRYIVTNQTSVLIDRGFDLLWDDTRMVAAGLNPATDPRPIRDVAIALCHETSAMEAQARTLPAF